jgi:hypothetical protein
MTTNRRSIRPGARALASLLVLLAPFAAGAQQAASSLLMTRADLIAAASRADSAASSGGNRAQNAEIAASARRRLHDGDFQAGDRIVLSYQADTEHRDTLTVRAARDLELPWKTTVSLAGVLRSEAAPLLQSVVLKYVKAESVEVTPLMRLGVLGEVARPGYFAFASDIPLTDVLMGAGGPTAGADMRRAVVRRGGKQLRSSDETSGAISAGLTLDQFGLAAGDELIIGPRRQGMMSPALTVIGAVASLVTVYVALGHR